jgi:hypothetical protein
MPLPRGQKKERLMLTQARRGLSNTTPFSRGRRLLRSGGPNYVNLLVHRVHLYSIADDQETKALSNKRTTAGCSSSSTGGSVAKLLRQNIPCLPARKYEMLVCRYTTRCGARDAGIQEMQSSGSSPSMQREEQQGMLGYEETTGACR